MSKRSKVQVKQRRDSHTDGVNHQQDSRNHGFTQMRRVNTDPHDIPKNDPYVIKALIQRLKQSNL